MSNRTVQGIFLAAALFSASVVPASAQTFSAGLSLLADDGGPGVNVDYSKIYKTMAMDRTLGWLADASFNHKSFNAIGDDFSFNTFIAQGGVRLTGKAGNNATWHVQGAAGVIRVSGSFGGETEQACKLVGIDCSASDTSWVITPAGALTYWFSPNRGVKAQLNFPFNSDNNNTRFDINYVMKLQ